MLDGDSVRERGGWARLRCGPTAWENGIKSIVMFLISMLAGGRLGRVVGLLNPGPAGLLFILFFIVLLAVMALNHGLK